MIAYPHQMTHGREAADFCVCKLLILFFVLKKNENFKNEKKRGPENAKSRHFLKSFEKITVKKLWIKKNVRVCEMESHVRV